MKTHSAARGQVLSAGQPTKLVKDGNIESYDEPPSEGLSEPGAAASSGYAVGGTLNHAEASKASRQTPFGEEVPAPARRRPRVGVFTAVAAVVNAGVVTAVVIVGKPRPAAAPVTEAMSYTATMNASSADVYPSYSIDVTVPLDTYPITLAVAFQLSHYGKPVHVIPPPAAQITNRVTCTFTADGFNCPSE